MPEELAGQVPFLMTVACLAVFTSSCSLPQLWKQRSVRSLRLKLQTLICARLRLTGTIRLCARILFPSCIKQELPPILARHTRWAKRPKLLIPKTPAYKTDEKVRCLPLIIAGLTNT